MDAVAPASAPTLCEVAALAGFPCSDRGVPVFAGPYQPRVELLTECEAAARMGQPCSGDGYVLSVEY